LFPYPERLEGERRKEMKTKGSWDNPNKDGVELINSLCERLKYLNKPLSNHEILKLIKTLSNHELNQLITFGNVSDWHNEQISMNWKDHVDGIGG